MECIFKDILTSCSNGEKSFSAKPLSEKQSNVIGDSSKKRKDGFIVDFKKLNPPLNYHTSCYASYTSKSKIEKFVSKKKSEDPSSSCSAAKRRLRSR